jgi:signal transduction histidine kinase
MSQKNRTYQRLEALFSDAGPAAPDSPVSFLPKARGYEAPEETRMIPVPENGGKPASPRLDLTVNTPPADASIAQAFPPPAAVSPADGWADFLDGIDRGSRMGFAYGRGQLTSLEEAPQPLPERALRVPLTVAGTTIGSLQADGDGEGWSAQQTEIANAAAAQLAQHLDGLRLLARAEKYRAEAELAVRRLTREGWKTFQQARDEIRTGFVFDHNLVHPLTKSGPNGAGELASRSLTVRNETIGELAVDAGSLPGGSLSEETREILDAVAGQLSGHLENLRLLEQNETRSHELEIVAELSATTSTELDPGRLLQSIVDLAKERFGVYHVHIYLADDEAQNLLLAAGAGEVGRGMVAKKHAIPVAAEKSIVARTHRERRAQIVNDVRGAPDFLPNPNLPETRSEMAVPMIVGGVVLGVFDVQSDRLNGFSEEDANIYTTLASQVAVALQNARLYMEQAETVSRLRELDRLKTSFLANMSHELRTPLNSILGFADVMLEGIDGELTETMDNDLHLIHKNGQHLLHLINDVLDMAKISAGKMNLTLEHFKVHDLLEEVYQISSSLAGEKKLSLMIEADSDRNAAITADRTRIRQVMLNLVSNAVKFTDQGGVSIRTQQKEDLVRIQVSDTGLGIPKDKLDLVFQEFTQVDTSATRKAGGTGLGLPISLSLVKMHGGRLWAESSGVPGEGTTFFVELPLEAKITEPEEAAKDGKA